MITYPDALSVTETTELSRIIARAFARSVSALVAARTRQMEHRTNSYLLGVDEQLLSGFGLTRADVQRALARR
jgi:uncharacterized protein YjiS (DUF1127 family)